MARPLAGAALAARGAARSAAKAFAGRATEPAPRATLRGRRRTKLLLVDPAVFVRIQREQCGRRVFDLVGRQGVVTVGIEGVAQRIVGRRSGRTAPLTPRRATGWPPLSSRRAAGPAALPRGLGQRRAGDGHSHRQRRTL